MKLLFDTNVVLDVLLNREPWVATAKELWRANDTGRISGFLTATTLTDIHYIARKAKGLASAREAVQLCLAAFEICSVERSDLEQAVALPGNDFEDNLQISVAFQDDLDAIVTRNPADYRDSLVPVLTPEEAWGQLSD